jgi:predicted Zn-dependent peptidase
MGVSLTPGSQPAGSTRTLSTGTDGGTVRRTVLAGGLRIITESIPTVRSVSFGIWAQVGSRDEDRPVVAGASHFLEHLLFKATKRRTALEIAAEIDAVGGEMNAFTSKETTCFYAKVLDTDLPLAVDVIVDMVTSSLVAPEDVDAERDVVLEEISMRDDDPSDAIHDEFSSTIWGDTPLGRPVLGTVQSITQMPRDEVAGYWSSNYSADRLVVTAAGNLDHDRLVELVTAAFHLAGALGPETAGPAGPRVGGDAPAVLSTVSVTNRKTEQANLVLGCDGLERDDDRRFALSVLNTVLGGGMSSRLFQEIREKRGMAYSVYSYASRYAGAGLFGVYVGCQPAKIDEVLKVAREQLDIVAADGLPDDELERGKGQVRGSYVLGLEDTGSRMSRLGKAELGYGELLGVDDVLGRIAAVTSEDVTQLAADLFSRPRALAVIGPFKDRDFSWAIA